MTHDATNIPVELRISFDAAPSVETRAALGHEIDEYPRADGATRCTALCPAAARRENRLVAGLSGLLSWQWLFVEALWVSDDWRSRGIGRALLAQAEAQS